jgi:hypothetical protein
MTRINLFMTRINPFMTRVVERQRAAVGPNRDWRTERLQTISIRIAIRIRYKGRSMDKRRVV